MSDGAMNSARSRIIRLLDDNSFIEIGAEVIARSTNFNVQDEKRPTDAVVTGYGLIEGNPVYVYAQSSDIMGGSIGEMHAAKICSIYDKAMLQGFPVIGLIDSSGIRLREGIDVLNAVSALYRKQTDASGVIPQLTVVYGLCGGSAAMIAGLSDIVYMNEKEGRLFVNPPNTLQDNHVDKLDSSSYAFQGKRAGNADACYSEDEILSQLRKLVTFLPSNNEDKRMTARTDDANRLVSFDKESDISVFIRELADHSDYIELKADYAKEVSTGLIMLNGQTVGIVANADVEYMSTDGCYKAARFVRFCNCFNIPILTLARSKGFRRTLEEESNILRASAALTSSYAMATVPKVTLVTGQLYGMAYNILGSKGIGADLVLGFATSEVGVMDAEKAVKIIFPDTDVDKLKEKAFEYAEKQQGAAAAASRGLIDTIIEPEYSRRYLSAAFDMLLTKREFSPVKKHSTL